MSKLPVTLLMGALLLPVSAAAATVAGSNHDAQGQVASERDADQVAARIRAAEAIPPSEARSAVLRVAADNAAALAADLDPDSRLWRRLQTDRMYALSLAGDRAGTVQVYDSLVSRNAAVPTYAAPGAAQGLFAVGRESEGEQLLLSASAQAPADPGPVITLAYLLHDAHHSDAGRRYLQEWLDRSTALTDITDANRVAAAIAMSRLDRWNESFSASAERLAALAKTNPDNPSIRIEQAALQRQRGRPRAALALLGQDQADAREIGAQAWLDLERPDRAAAVLVSGSASDASTRLAAQRGSRGEFSVAYANTQSPAIGSPTGNSETAVSLRIDGPLIADAWRVGAHLSHRQADFRGITPQASYAGVRVVRQDTGGETALEIGRTFDNFLQRNYGILDAAYWVRDDVRLAARVAVNDPEGPLQARASGIGIDSLALSATWRPSEAGRVDGSVGTTHFDDGNRRNWGSLSGERRLRANGTSVTTGFASVYLSSNSLDNAPYFNPARDTTVEFGLVQRLTDRRGDVHTLRPSIARYQEEGFDARWIPRLSYSLRIPLHNEHWLDCDLGGARPVYDGQRETRWWLSLTYGWGE